MCTMRVRVWVQINAHSSRSHCLLIINVVGSNLTTGVRTVGKLTLCDLAGSERINKTGATGAPRSHPCTLCPCLQHLLVVCFLSKLVRRQWQEPVLDPVAQL